MAQEASVSTSSRNGNFVQMQQQFPFQLVGMEKGEYLLRSSICYGKSPVKLHILFAFELVELNILANQKSPEYLEKKNLLEQGENQQQTQPMYDSDPGVGPGPHWWEVSALTTEPHLLTIFGHTRKTK